MKAFVLRVSLFCVAIFLITFSAKAQTAQELYDQMTKADKPDEIVRLSTLVIEKDPNFPIPYIFRSYANIQLGNLGAADKDIETFYEKFKGILKDKPPTFLDMIVEMMTTEPVKSMRRIQYNNATEEDQKSIMLPAYIFAKANIMIKLQKEGKLAKPYTAVP